MSHSNLLHVWIGRFTAALSFIGSSLICYMILSDRKRKLTRPYHRLMLAMSFFIILHCIPIFISVMALPVESHIYGAKGNAFTCTVQGFFMVLGLSIPLYNSSLNIYYVSTIRYNISSQKFTYFEPVLHAFSILIPLSLSIAFAAFDTMSPMMNGACSARGEAPIWLMQSVFIFCAVICISAMIILCWTVVSQANQMGKYTIIGKTLEEDKKETLKQAFLYVSAFILTYIFPFMGAASTRGMAGVVPSNTVMILTSIFYPLQGFWNFCFFVRPGVDKILSSNPGKTRFAAVLEVIFCPESTSKRASKRASNKRRGENKSCVHNNISFASKSEDEFITVPVGNDEHEGRTECQTVNISHEMKLNAGEQTKSLDDNVLTQLTSNLCSDKSSHIEITNKESGHTDTSKLPDIIFTDKVYLDIPISRNTSTDKLRRKSKIETRRYSLLSISSILNDNDYEDCDCA